MTLAKSKFLQNKPFFEEKKSKFRLFSITLLFQLLEKARHLNKQHFITIPPNVYFFLAYLFKQTLIQYFKFIRKYI